MIRYIVTNFGCGNGPFLRAIDLALAVRDRLLSTLGQTDEIRILVPHVYGEKMVRLIREAYGALIESHPTLFVFDDGLGSLLENLLYNGRDFRITLDRLVNAYPEIQSEVDRHVSETIPGTFLDGRPISVRPDELWFSVSRNPNVRMGNLRSFYTSIGYLERILRETMIEPELNRYDPELVRRAAEHARRAEDGQEMYFQFEPSAFSWATDPKPFRAEEIRTPPMFHPPVPIVDRELEPGVYVLVSGIPELGRLYRDVTAQGWKVYVNEMIDEIPGAIRLEPTSVMHPSIQAVYARAAWNTIWLANLARKPLICPDFLPEDFPEIFFNNRCVERLHLGTIVRTGASAAEAIEASRGLQPAIDARYADIASRFGTLDGIEHAASQIAKAMLA